MKIGIVGTGRVAEVLGKTWSARGHAVRFGGRDPEKARALAVDCPGAQGGTIRSAVDFGDVVVLAVSWSAVLPVVEALGAPALAGKVIIDCTNPLREDDFTEPCDLDGAASGAELISARTPGAQVVKAFNMVSTAVMQGPRYDDHPACLLYCGDDAEAKQVVSTLIEDVGFEPLDIGGLVEARRLESVAVLMIRLAFRQGLGPDVAWKLLRRSDLEQGGREAATSD
jgi:predicted dinucleotide-binding enzyme